ncbi:c(7)-type cytochrome triheme domain-containing protein [Sedimenticola sp.]|uniref:c(7)-type cytochrome triheme domain-containing protein n=1 Tax=Sedimenticola sp. TaxID=1940285 RepID=UPI003D0D1F16
MTANMRPVLGVVLLSLVGFRASAVEDKGKQIVDTVCSACHVAGVLNAPKLGDIHDWMPRLQQGEATLVKHANEGFKSMPPKGGNPALSAEDIKLAVHHMMGLVGESIVSSKSAISVPPVKSEVAEKVPGKPVPDRGKAVAEKSPVDSARSVVVEKPAARPVPKPVVLAKASPKSRRVNSFNRLLRPADQRNLPPAKDGIHDPENDGTEVLQHPKEAFSSLNKANSGNRVDWVKSLESDKIGPRYDRLDPDKQPVVLDLNIVREVKGSMPDVVYPHKPHTEWLDCSNCHPAIFIPKKGANNISMASILMGEQCGVCHGKVAFPVAECRKCHSKNKPMKK